VQLGKQIDDNSSLRTLIELKNTKKLESQEIQRRVELSRTQQLAQEREAEGMMEKYIDAFDQLHVRDLVYTSATPRSRHGLLAGVNRH